LLLAGWFIRLSSLLRDGRSSLRRHHPGNRVLKYLRKSLFGLAVLLLAAALLLWFLPARWVAPWIEPQLHGLQLREVHGLLWNGQADRVTGPDGRVLGHLHWRLSRRALFGQVRLQLEFHGPQLDFSGAMQTLPAGQVEWRDVSLHAAFDALGEPVQLPWGQPRGELQLAITRVLLQGGWPLQMHADAQWRHALMHTRAGDVALGELQAQSQAQDGVIQVRLRDDGHGPLHVEGHLQLSPLGWRLDAVLHPRQTADQALRHWLAGLGSPAADGSVHIQRHGGLAGVTAPPSN
jgi:general secretion pathway protein N